MPEEETAEKIAEELTAAITSEQEDTQLSDETPPTDEATGEPDADVKVEEEESAEEKEAEEEKEEAKPEEIPDELVEQAIRSGMSMTAAKGFKDAAHLQEVLAMLPKEKEEEEEQKESMLDLLDKDTIDEGVYGVLEKMSAALTASETQHKTDMERIAALEEGTKQSADYMNQQKTLDLSRSYDPVFAEMGIDDEVGKDTASITDKQLKTRLKILTEAGIQAEAYKRNNKKAPSNEVLVQRATEVLLGKQGKAPYMGKPSGKRKPGTKQAELKVLGDQLSSLVK